MNYAGFLNESLGITVGYSAEIHYSKDGGKTWPNGNNNSMCLFGLEILDQAYAWTCGNDGQVRITENSGETWKSISSFGGMEPYQPKFISFCDVNNGLIANCSKMGITSDGGKQWQTIKNPDNLKKVAAVHVLSPTESYVLSADAVLFITRDNGKTWQLIPVDLKGRKTNISNSSEDFPTCAMRFTSPNDGVIAALCTKPKEGLLVLRTVDGGQTWNEDKTPDDIKTGKAVFLSRNGKLLTLKTNRKITVLEYR